MSGFAQDEVKFKEVLLDGKPAKLNVATGEITLAKIEDKVVETKVDSVVIKPIMVTDSNSINASSEPEFSDGDASDFHIVEDGENLFRLSVKYTTSLSELKKANNLETTLIKKGQKLRVRNFDKVSETNNPSVWMVKKGDNLYRIALESGTTVKTLKRINNLKSDVIKIGQQLQLK